MAEPKGFFVYIKKFANIERFGNARFNKQKI